MSLAAFSDLELVELDATLDVVLDACGVSPVEKAIRRVPGLVRLQLELEARMAVTWTGASKTAIRDAARVVARAPAGSLPTAVAASALDTLGEGIALGTVESLAVTGPGMAATMERIWRKAKNLAAPPAVTPSFALRDTRAVAALHRDNMFWIGNHYNRHLRTRVGAVVNDLVIKRGFGTTEAGATMKRAVSRELGRRGRSAFARAVPGRWAGRVDEYFKMVAGSSASRARSFSAVETARDVGAEQMRWIAIGDERTDPECLELDGQLFSTQSAVQNMERQLAAATPDDVRDVAPWLSESAQTEIIASAPDDPSAALARAGIIVPPRHGSCRCVLEVVI